MSAPARPARPSQNTSSGRTARFTLSALERRVFLVAVAGLLPVAILSCVLLIWNAREQKDGLLRANEDTMIALLSAADAELKGDIAALDALAASPRLARGDFAGVREEALELLGRRSTWLNVMVFDAERQFLNARVPTDSPLPPVAQRELAMEVLQRKSPVVGQVVFSNTLQAHAVMVLVPYVRQGDARFLLAALVRPDSFLELLELQNVGGNGVIGVFDRRHHVVARSLNQAQWVGRPPAPGLLRMLESEHDRGVAITTTLEGVPVYTVFRRSAFSNWAAAIGIPKQEVDGPVVRSYLLLGGAVFASIVLGILAATLVGRTIVQPMSELERSAARVGRGEAPTLPTTRLAEVQRVAVALAHAHDERAASFQREREARLAAEQASKAKDEFLAMLGHELRNPLAAITTASQLVERQRASLDSSAAAAMSIITRQSHHLARMTDDLLDAGRVILGKISLNRAPLDLAASVSTALESLRSTGRLGEHQWDLRLEPAWVYADATRIDQIVVNLITNAVKYTPAGGRVTVCTRREGGEAVLVVADTGIGVDPALLPRVFELFVQGERTLDRSQGGLGIGLTLVKRLTELHGGTAEAGSAGHGKGATFIVRLPATDAPAVPDEEDRGSPPEVKRRIALVEDNEDARLSLRMLLELDGHEVVEAGDGETGIELLSANPGISIAFVDIGLPRASGYAVARAVRERRGRSIRLVAMSGYGGERDVQQGMEAGFDAYIVKPAEPEVLREELLKAAG
jgi:signal transduction histidine kinase